MNDSQTYANALVYQSFTTVPGKTYTVSFDFGNYSLPGTTAANQALLAQVFDGTRPIFGFTGSALGQTNAVDNSPSNGSTTASAVFGPRQSFTFTARLDHQHRFSSPIAERLEIQTRISRTTAMVSWIT